MKNIFIAFAIFSFGFLTTANAESIEARISNPYPYQGETAVITFSDPKRIPDSATFNGRNATFFRYKNRYAVVIGIPPIETPGIHEVVVHFTNGETYTREILVRKKRFPYVVLGIPEELGLTPTGLVAKLKTEKENLQKVLGIRTPEIFFEDTFGLPLRDNRRIGSVFGEIRKTGNQEIRHLGVDLTAPKGAAVGAINAGVVRKAYFDTVYGNTVVVDHGQGIFSLYLHLDRMAVKEGTILRRGSLIGRVGSTGYAEAPHLHLSIKINDVPVDPLNFVAQLK